MRKMACGGRKRGGAGPTGHLTSYVLSWGLLYLFQGRLPLDEQNQWTGLT